jgi:two-component system NtrC family sensor kinase
LLRESMYLRDYLSKLLDHASAPILVVGRNREIRVINKTLRTLTGLIRETLVGRDFVSMLPESQRERMTDAFNRAMLGESMANVEVILPRATGGTTRLLVNVAAILRPDGEVEAVIAIGRDLTAVRELEDQVIQAEKLATLGQLAAGVVHELNNPLTSISVYSDYLLKKAERAQTDPSDIEKLRRILESADRILNFTRDLVTYARPSSEQPKDINVKDVLDQAVVFCEHVISERGVVVEKKYADDLSPITAVRSQMHQVFINLITNACHAMPQDAGKLLIEATSQKDGRVCIRVRDNGSGIRPGDADRVFEPFFTTKGEGKGTGLGLSIVRNIVQQHRGEITVESEMGRGTTFSVLLEMRVNR